MLGIKRMLWYPALGWSTVRPTTSDPKTAGDVYVKGRQVFKFIALNNEGQMNCLFKREKDLEASKTCQRRECVDIPAGVRWNKKTKQYEEYTRRVCYPAPCD